MARRNLVIKIPPEALRDLDRFIQRVSTALKVPEASFRLGKEGVLRVEVKGSRAEVREALARLKSVISEFTVVHEKASNIYSVKWITNIAGGTISLDVLVEALKAKGYTAYVNEERLETSASKEVVSHLASLIREAYEYMKEPLYSRAFRKAIALAHTLTEKPVSEIIAMAEQRGYAIRKGEKIFVKGSWKSVARDLSSPKELGNTESL